MTTEPASRREPLIQITGLRKSYVLGDVTVHALRGVDVEIAGGTFVTVVGASGSGKSTFMNILGLLDRPSGGQYFLEGEDVSGFDRDRRAVDGFARRSWLGYAEDHALTLDFGDIPVSPDRLWFLVLDRGVHLREAVQEHREALQAIVNRDAPTAEAVMRRHVTGFEQQVRRAL